MQVFVLYIYIYEDSYIKAIYLRRDDAEADMRRWIELHPGESDRNVAVQSFHVIT